jgi:hypothetical protein
MIDNYVTLQNTTRAIMEDMNLQTTYDKVAYEALRQVFNLCTTKLEVLVANQTKHQDKHDKLMTRLLHEDNANATS